ncbi:hypothetical protein GCM10027610_033910 [Dactylosporangium cerinum]
MAWGRAKGKVLYEWVMPAAAAAVEPGCSAPFAPAPMPPSHVLGGTVPVPPRERLLRRPADTTRPAAHRVVRCGPSASIPGYFPPPARNATQASLIRSACPAVNMFMHESCE